MKGNGTKEEELGIRDDLECPTTTLHGDILNIEVQGKATNLKGKIAKHCLVENARETIVTFTM